MGKAGGLVDEWKSWLMNLESLQSYDNSIPNAPVTHFQKQVKRETMEEEMDFLSFNMRSPLASCVPAVKIDIKKVPYLWCRYRWNDKMVMKDNCRRLAARTARQFLASWNIEEGKPILYGDFWRLDETGYVKKAAARPRTTFRFGKWLRCAGCSKKVYRCKKGRTITFQTRWGRLL